MDRRGGGSSTGFEGDREGPWASEVFPLYHQWKAQACRLPAPQGMELASGEFPSISAPPRPHGRAHL
ncbi:hypothetical protein ILYODFUR_003255 [Ilyodon furcidens]|uniref:Uncharacterized protein n=1 Tax=Ilyodon furcidens TaxID=33524 RepID=A0ABV0VAP0_9TELE